MANKPPYQWEEYKVEIDALLRSYYPNYEERIYLKPVFYLPNIEHDPGLYPMLAELSTFLQKRYISLFLKEQGRVQRNANGLNARCWMIPEAAK